MSGPVCWSIYVLVGWSDRRGRLVSNVTVYARTGKPSRYDAVYPYIAEWFGKTWLLDLEFVASKVGRGRRATRRVLNGMLREGSLTIRHPERPLQFPRGVSL